MADELRFRRYVDVERSGVPPLHESADFYVDIAATGKWYTTIQTIGTSEEALLLGDLTPTDSLGNNRGFITRFSNLDATNYVEIKTGSGAAPVFCRLYPGEEWELRMGPSVTPYAIANTSSVRLAYRLFQEG